MSKCGASSPCCIPLLCCPFLTLFQPVYHGWQKVSTHRSETSLGIFIYLCGSNIRFYLSKTTWNKEPGEIFCLLQAHLIRLINLFNVTPHPRPGRPPYIVLTFLNQNICFHNSAESQLQPHVRCHHWLHTPNWYFSYPSYNNLILSCSNLIRVLINISYIHYMICWYFTLNWQFFEHTESTIS